jgi:hypothetical protein
MSKTRGRTTDANPKLTPLGKLVGDMVRLSGASKAGEMLDNAVLSAISHKPFPATRIGVDRRLGMLYSDKGSKRMLKRRKREYRAFFSICTFMWSMVTLVCVVTILNASGNSIASHIMAIVLSVSLFLLSGVLLNYIFMDSGNALRFGISLTERELSLNGEIIPVSSITRALIVHFWGSWRDILAIDCKESKKGHEKVRTVFVLEYDTEDIYELRDAIKEVKKWGGLPQLSPEHLSLKDWKKSSGLALS